MKRMFECTACGTHEVTETDFNRCITADIRAKLASQEERLAEAKLTFGHGATCPDCAKNLDVIVKVHVVRKDASEDDISPEAP